MKKPPILVCSSVHLFFLDSDRFWPKKGQLFILLKFYLKTYKPLYNMLSRSVFDSFLHGIVFKHAAFLLQRSGNENSVTS